MPVVKYFFAHDLDEKVILCRLWQHEQGPQQLQMFRLVKAASSTRMELLFSLDVQAARPVQCTRDAPYKDVLVQLSEHKMGLYFGATQYDRDLFFLPCHTAPTHPTETIAPPARKIMRFSLDEGDGDASSLLDEYDDHLPLRDQLVRDTLLLMRHNLPEREYLLLFTAFFTFRRTYYSQSRALLHPRPTSPEFLLATLLIAFGLLPLTTEHPKGEKSAWDTLLGITDASRHESISTFTQRMHHLCTAFSPSDTTIGFATSHVPRIVHVLSYLKEGYIFLNGQEEHVHLLQHFLRLLSVSFDWPNWKAMHASHEKVPFRAVSATPEPSKPQRVNEMVHTLLQGKACDIADVQVVVATDTGRTVYDCLFLLCALQQRSFDRGAFLDAMVARGMTRQTVQRFPMGVQLVFWEILSDANTWPSSDWLPEQMRLIDRDDLVHTILRDASAEEAPRHDLGVVKKANHGEDGMGLCYHAISTLRFSVPLLEDVRKVFATHQPLRLKLTHTARLHRYISHVCQWNTMLMGVTREHDIEMAKMALLVSAAGGIMSAPVGRALFTYGCDTSTVPNPIVPPPMVIAARFYPNYTFVKTLEPGMLPTQAGQQARDWPDFHNAVATALTIPPSTKITDEGWIFAHSATMTKPQFAGLLLGLGLNGHLKGINKYRYADIWHTTHELTQIGIVLGRAISQMGTMDTDTERVVRLHVPALLPANSTDLNIPANVQSAALVAYGLLFLQSGSEHCSGHLLGEIGRDVLLVADANTIYRDGYALASGMALGLIHLAPEEETQVEEVEMADAGKENHATNGASQSQKPRRRRHYSGDKFVEQLSRYIHGGTGKEQPNALAAEGALSTEIQANRFRERESINTHVTAPGAMIALAMMYMKTNHHHVARRLDLPATRALMEYVKPEQLLLRITMRSLILWDAIAPTKEWIRHQVPSYLRQQDSSDRQIARHIRAGCFWAIGLKFAGSRDPQAIALLTEQLEAYIGSNALHASQVNSSSKTARRLTEQAISVITLSLAMVAAGSGDLAIYRLFRRLHGRTPTDLTYGDQVAVNMAVGFLFLGAGTTTLCHSTKGVAGLLMATYPHFPSVSSDQRSHLQAFRYLWVMAVEARCLITRDVVTKALCQVPLEMEVQRAPGAPLALVQTVSPVIVPAWATIHSIQPSSPRYCAVHIHLNGTEMGKALAANQVIWVKRRTGHAAHEKYLNAASESSVQPLYQQADIPDIHSERRIAQRKDFLASLALDGDLYQFALHFCRLGEGAVDKQHPFPKLCTTVLQTVLDDGSHWLHPIYMSLVHVFTRILTAKAAVTDDAVTAARAVLTEKETWMLRHMFAFYQWSQSRVWQSRLARTTAYRPDQPATLLRFDLLFQIMDHLDA